MMMAKLFFRAKLIIAMWAYERAIRTIISHFENECIRWENNHIDREMYLF